MQTGEAPADPATEGRPAASRATPPLTDRVGGLVRGWHAAAWVVLAMVGLYVAVLGTLTWKQQSNFGTFGFDMGIYDQGIWLVSRLREPFLTVRGLNYFGHHVNVITLLFVPAYWLGAGPHFLYLVQTVWLAAGAVPLYLLGRDRLQSPWAGTTIAACYLLYPSLEWMNWWHFHPDSLIITPLLFAWWLAHRRSWRWFWVAIGVALACKEDAGLAVLVLGLVLAWKTDRRRGLATAAAGIVWFSICTKLVIPWANGGIAPFYSEFFPGFGTSINEIAWNMIRHPGHLWEVASAGGHGSPRSYYWQLLAPVAFVPLAAPFVLLIGAPQTLVNVVSAHSLTHDIHYHYSAIVTAAIFLATVEGLARIRALPLRHAAIGAIAIASLASNFQWSPSPLGRDYRRGIWAFDAVPKHAAVNDAIRMVPRDAGVSAVYNLVPHLTHRSEIFEWPNPFVVTNWGAPGSKPPRADQADWLVLDRTELGTSAPLLDSLTGPSGTFEVIFERDGIVAARRRR